jgi:hypothetical protein
MFCGTTDEIDNAAVWLASDGLLRLLATKSALTAG